MDPRGDVNSRPKAPIVSSPSLGTTVFRGDRLEKDSRHPRTDAQHFPNVVYTPYIMTGDRFYLDQLKLWANGMALKFWPANGSTKDGIDVSRQGAKGIMAFEWGGGGGGRGWAWPLRELINAATATPQQSGQGLFHRSGPQQPRLGRHVQHASQQDRHHRGNRLGRRCRTR